MTPQPVGIVAVGAYAPPKVLTNFDLEKFVDTSDEWIRTRTGIVRRHVVTPGTSTSDLAVPAARQALERAGITPEELDVIVVATCTPDMLLPSTACFLQHGLGAVNAAAFDVAAACTGFIYATNIIMPALQAGMFRNALVIGADTLTPMVDFTDRSTCVLFGDGAGAAVLRAVPEGRGILSTYLRADGSGAEMLTIPGGGSRNPASPDTLDRHMHYIHMSGNEVFKFAVRAVDDAISTSLERAGLTYADVDLIIPHQANIRIIEAVQRRVNIPEDRWIINIQEYSNTSAGTIPIALNEAYEQGRLHEGDVVVLVGFGGGLTWGATVLRW
jgi:3-oxoacyl-[acyl-carrier-protein] synthase-3